MKSAPLFAALCALLPACDDASGDPPVGDATIDATRPLTDRGPLFGDAATDAGAADMGCDCPGQQTCADGACVEPAACAGPEDCLDGRQCVGALCRDRCAADEECPAGELCDPADQVCVVDAGCTLDVDCGPNGLCVDGGCIDRCADGDCPGAQVCDAETGRCVEPPGGCVEDVDCVDARVCVDGACVQACAEDAGCAGAQTCIDGRCAEPEVCTGDGDCLVDRLCVASACADPCTRVPCTGALLCAADTGRCAEAEPCGGDDGCFPGRRCAGGVCVDPCVEDADCPGGQRCVDGQCSEPAVCNDPLDCDPGRTCDRGACRDRCDRTPCAGALRCDPGTGLCGEADPCVDDDGCFAGNICEDGTCTPPCRENADCPGAMSCVDRMCAEPEICFGDDDCIGARRCLENRCLELCADGRCPGARVCDGAACVEGPGCSAAADCDAGRVCHPELEACVARCVGGVCAVDRACDAMDLCIEAPGCIDDAQCIGDRGCRLGMCRGVACEAHGDCDDRCVEWTCAEARPLPCLVGWRARDGHCEQPGPCAAGVCPEAFVCAPSGLCVGCLEDAGCPGAGICVDGFCADPPECLVDAACLPGRICDGGTCALADCDEDALAPNHQAADAWMLPLVDLTGLRACEARPDWFAVGGADGVRVTARFAADRPPLQLELFPAAGPNGPAVDRSRPTPGEAWVDAGPGDYLLRITAPPGGEADYSLRLDSTDCDEDPFERPWRNDGEAAATPIGAGALEGTLCMDDVDWYRYDGPGQVQVGVDGGARGTVNGEALPATVDAPALIRIAGAGAYTLTVTPDDRPGPRCAAAPLAPLGEPFPVDVFEGPDSFAPACLAHSGPDQVFRVDVPRAATLRATLLDPQPGAAALIYADCDAAPLACSDALGEASAQVAQGAYRLVVEGPYVGRVRLDLVEPGVDLCANPPLLQPDQPVQVEPSPMAPNLGGRCLLPGADTTVFRFDVAEASQVQLNYDGAGPNARLSLRRACAEGPSEVSCESGAAPALAERLDAGGYYAAVQGDPGGTLRLGVAPDAVDAFLDDMCFPGGAAAVLAPGADLDLMGSTADAFDAFDATGCDAAPGGADRVLQFEVRAPVRLRASAASAEFSPVLSVLGDDCFAAPMCGAPGAQLDLRLPAGAWGLVVDGDGPAGGDFTLNVQVLAP